MKRKKKKRPVEASIESCGADGTPHIYTVTKSHKHFYMQCDDAGMAFADFVEWYKIYQETGGVKKFRPAVEARFRKWLYLRKLAEEL